MEDRLLTRNLSNERVVKDMLKLLTAILGEPRIPYLLKIPFDKRQNKDVFSKQKLREAINSRDVRQKCGTKK